MTLAQLRRRLIFGTAVVTAAGLAAGPANATLTISNGATKNVSCSAGVCAATAKNAVLNAGELANMLASGDVSVQSKSKAKDIELRVALSFASASRLTLDAYQSITFDKPLTVAGSGALTLTTNDGGTGGELSFVAPGRVAFWDLSSSLVIDGASYTLVGDIATLASDIAADASGHYALADNYDASVDGTYASSPIATTFTGTFEGLGNTISHLSISDTNTDDDIALFETLDSSSVARDVSLAGIHITAGEASSAAGLVALNDGLVLSDKVSGSIKVKAPGVFHTPIVGGLVAFNTQTVSRSSAAVKITVSGKFNTIGGLIGSNSGTVDSSFATGPIIGGNHVNAGSLIGHNYGGILNSYAVGSVAVGTDSSVGGTVGLNHGFVERTYSIGAPTGDSGSFVGGFIGDDQSNLICVDCYWDVTTSGITDLSRGAGNRANDPDIVGMTTTQLQSQLPSGFDPSIWAEAPGVNDGFPYLLSNPPP